MFTRTPIRPGLRDGRLAPCPDTPNCVSSELDPASDAGRHVPPLPAGAWPALVEALARLPRVRIVVQAPDYLHAEFRTAVFRFVDDVEFRLDRERGVVHVRSASRLGHSDFGVNRRRVERLRRLLGGGIP